MRKNISEGLDYHDLEGMLQPTISVDEYASKMGKDSEIVTLAFVIRSENAANDLVDWFERGYDYVLDAQVSDGELTPGKFLVFVELSRRSTVPANIVELLSDLETLTDIKLAEWVVRLGDEEYEADEEVLKQVLTISPHEYRESEDAIEAESEEGLNEMRKAAGLPVKKLYACNDPELKNYLAMAGL